MLKNVLKKIKELDILLVPFGVDKEELKANNNTCIVYNYAPVAKSNRFRLDIRIISNTLLDCVDIKENLENSLVGVGDTVKVPGISSINFSTGASAREFETNTVHLIFSIEIIGRKIQ